MVTALVDTSVVVDILRGYDPALDWYSQQTGLATTRVVWMEVIEGARDKRAQQQAVALLRRFDMVNTTDADVTWATEQLLNFYLSHNIDSFDCMIAAVSHRLSLPVWTRNLKHFQPLLQHLAQSPY